MNKNALLDHAQATAQDRATEPHATVFGPRREWRQQSMLHALVHDSATRHADAVAIKASEGTWTYQQLESHANRLARYLREQAGVRPGDTVGILMPKSGYAIVAMLGILKACGAYVPIDPGYPWSVAGYMLDHARIKVALTLAETVSKVANFSGHLFMLDIELDERPCLDAEEAAGSDSALAYAIYTSGSTGRQKCVAVQHKAIVNTVLWRNEHYGINHEDVILQIPSMAFDASVLDVFCGLSAGARLVLPVEQKRVDGEYMRRLVEEEQVSRFIVTPSYYRLMLNDLAGVKSLRTVTVAGEVVTDQLVQQHFSVLPHVRLINEYGPTENAVCSTAGDLTFRSPVTIGQPITNVNVTLLDSVSLESDHGAPGEIFLSGTGLASGYLNQPALTAERFLPDPFAAEPGSRMYRTGDRGEWTSDGNLRFLGRVDRQVKVRGFRIELGEIEASLGSHPAVTEVVVLCKQRGAGELYLSAYVGVPTAISIEELASHCRHSLPQQMRPDVIKVMAELPRSRNGKLNLAFFRQVDDFAATASSGDAPRSELESSLASACAELFERPDFDVNENFFSAGANSLKVMEMITRFRNTLNISVDLQDVYSFPSIRELSCHILTRKPEQEKQRPHCASN